MVQMRKGKAGVQSVWRAAYGALGRSEGSKGHMGH